MTTTASVKGKVYSSASGQPVEGATIMVTGGDYEHQDIASQSDEQGVFYLPELQLPGTYTLQIHSSNESKTVTVNINSKDTVLKIPL